MASKIILYYRTLSPPSRAVLLTAKAIGLNLELKDVNVLKGEHLTPEYRKVRYVCISSVMIMLALIDYCSDESATYYSNHQRQRYHYL